MLLAKRRACTVARSEKAWSAPLAFFRKCLQTACHAKALRRCSQRASHTRVNRDSCAPFVKRTVDRAAFKCGAGSTAPGNEAAKWSGKVRSNNLVSTASDELPSSFISGSAPASVRNVGADVSTIGRRSAPKRCSTLQQTKRTINVELTFSQCRGVRDFTAGVCV